MNNENIVQTNNEELIDKGEKYLPIGTVVLLKGANKRIMIIGFCSAESDNMEEIYDYMGCLYPEGYINEESLLFNHEQIEKVCYKGLMSDEEVEFKNKLKISLSKVDVKKIVKNLEQNSSNSTINNDKTVTTSNQAGKSSDIPEMPA